MRRMMLTLVAAAFVVSPALAQPRPGGGGFGGPLSLLSNKSVAEELKITDDQKKKIEDANKKIGELRTTKMKDAGVTRENFREKATEVAKVTKEVGEAAEKELDTLLTTDQKKRYGQIRLQQQGTRAFSTEKVQTALKMTDEQKTKIKEIGEALSKEREEIFKGINFRDRDSREKFQAAQKKFEEKRKEAEGKIAATLTADQKKVLKEMKGEPFEIKFDRPGGGRRPGQGNRPRPDLN